MNVTSDTGAEELRQQIKDLLFMPVHIDHQNIEPNSITITREGLDHYTDRIIEIFQPYLDTVRVEAQQAAVKASLQGLQTFVRWHQKPDEIEQEIVRRIATLTQEKAQPPDGDSKVTP